MKTVCATIAHDEKLGGALAQRVSDAVYYSCREGRLKLSGFPNFNTVIGDLSDTAANAAADLSRRAGSYSVTSPQPDGS